MAQHLENPATREREIRALGEALREVRVENALILSGANEEPFDLAGTPVQVRSLAEWMLGQPG